VISPAAVLEDIFSISFVICYVTKILLLLIIRTTDRSNNVMSNEQWKTKMFDGPSVTRSNNHN